MNDFIGSLRKDPNENQRYNTGVDLKRVAVVLMVLAIIMLPLALKRVGNSIEYVSEATVTVTSCTRDKHYNRHTRGVRHRYYYVNAVRFEGTFEDGSKLNVQQKVNSGLYQNYSTAKDRAVVLNMKVYRSEDTGRYYLSLKEGDEALAEYQSANRGTLEMICGWFGVICLLSCVSFYFAGEKLQRSAASFMPPPMASFMGEDEQRKRDEEQRMYDEAAKIFDKK